jgi:outer membrane receptor protein involved in Fe transport
MPGFGASLAVDHWGGYRDTQARPVRRVDAWTTADLRLSYRIARNGSSLDDIEVGLNASNVFDRSPPFVDSEIGFDTSNAHAFGRVISLTVQKRW